MQPSVSRPAGRDELCRALTVLSAFAALAACGGGGGSAPAPAPTPTPPAYTGERFSLAQLPASCIQGGGCLPFTSVSVNAAGEAEFLWEEKIAGGNGRLAAANHAAGGAALLGSGTLATGFVTSTVAPTFSARAIGPRRVVVWQYDYPAPGAIATNPIPLHARVVDFSTSGPPIAAALTTLPSGLSSGLGGNYPYPAAVQDSGGNLFAFTDTTVTAGSVVDLGGGQSLTVVPNPQYAGLIADDARVSDFGASIAPRALWAVRGRLSGAADTQVFVANISLPGGTVLPPSQVSTQSYAAGNLCPNSPRAEAAVSPSGISEVVTWTQLNAAATGCDLMVNGVKVNAGRSVGQFAVSGSANEVVAVWQEFEPNGTSHQLLWSRRPVPTPVAPIAAWSTPAPVAPAYVASTDGQFPLGMVAGPDGTLLVVWQNLQSMGPGSWGGDATWRVSKYVAGSWTTQQGTTVDRPTSLAINAAGQGAGLFLNNNCGASNCEELAAYRF